MIREYFKERDRKARHAAIRSLHTDPHAARHWHNPADPVQAARIEAAAAKRNRKELKFICDMVASTNGNWAHGHGTPSWHLTPVPHYSGRLNPFCVAH